MRRNNEKIIQSFDFILKFKILANWYNFFSFSSTFEYRWRKIKIWWTFFLFRRKNKANFRTSNWSTKKKNFLKSHCGKIQCLHSLPLEPKWLISKSRDFKLEMILAMRKQGNFRMQNRLAFSVSLSLSLAHTQLKFRSVKKLVYALFYFHSPSSNYGLLTAANLRARPSSTRHAYGV